MSKALDKLMKKGTTELGTAFSVARRYPFTNNSKRFCEKCLRTELSNLIEELKKQK